MGRDLHIMIRCSAEVMFGSVDLVQYWHLSYWHLLLKAGMVRIAIGQVSEWRLCPHSLCPEPCSIATCSQHSMFTKCFRNWCLLASVRVRCLSFLRTSVSALYMMDVASLGYLRHLSVILSWVKGLSSHHHCWTRLISSTIHMASVRNVVGPSVFIIAGKDVGKKM